MLPFTMLPLLTLLGFMCVAVLMVMLVVGVASGVGFLYGIVIAGLNAGLLYWRWYQGSRRLHCDGARHLRSFYRSMLERFFVVGILLAAGFALTRVQPLAILAGFLIGQLAVMLASMASSERT